MLKKTVIELGGSDPYVILEDADLSLTVRACVNSRLLNSGQSCIAAKRFIVVDAIKEKFVQLFVEQMKAVKMGNPLDPDTIVGPQARVDLREALDWEQPFLPGTWPKGRESRQTNWRPALVL